MRVGLIVIATIAACGPPLARNVPQPNTAAVAGVAAGAAAAITLADPAGAAARQEEKNKDTKEKKPQKVKGTVPSDVLDRLDAKQKRDTATPDAAPAQTPEPSPGGAP